MNINNCPGNSNKGKDENHQKKVNKVISGKVVSRKESFSEKAQNAILGDSIGNTCRYLLDDVIIPAVKNTVADIVQDGIETILFGEVRRGHRGRGPNIKSALGRVSYNSIYASDRRDSRDEIRYSRRRNDVRDIILESRSEAEDVLSALVTIVEDYGQATVADLYDLVGEAGTFTDNRIGWKSLSTAEVTRVREGYLVKLPAPRAL